MAGFNATSSTPLNIAIGVQNLVTQSALGYVTGDQVLLEYTLNSTIYMSGMVTAYNSVTGAMTVNITSVSGDFGLQPVWNTVLWGSTEGLYNSWTISLIGGVPTSTTAVTPTILVRTLSTGMTISTTAVFSISAFIVTVASPTGIMVGQAVSGYGIQSNTFVTSVNGSTIGISLPTQFAFTGPLGFTTAAWDPQRGNGLQNFLTDINAVAQIISQKLKFLQGEWFENTSIGLPLFQSLLGHSTTTQAVALILRQQILSTPYVVGINSFTINFAGHGRVFSYTASVQTAFGAITVTQ